jgi:hypothetical protein
MGPVIDPDSQAFDLFTRGDRGGRADDGNENALPTNLDTENTEAAGFAMERDALQGLAWFVWSCHGEGINLPAGHRLALPKTVRGPHQRICI